MTQKRLPAMPNPKQILLDAPIYKRFKKDTQKIVSLRNFTNPLDFYCPQCEEKSTFRRHDITPATLAAQSASLVPGVYPHREPEQRLFDLEYECTRYKHISIFYFVVDENSVFKIGEYPSRVSRFSDEMPEYKKILGDEYMSLQIARELYSQGIGAGAFVYLRRIFENVIVKRVARRKYREVSNWNYTEWKNQHSTMDRKLSDLSKELPDFINNQELFRVLSAAVHELDETACLQHFTLIEKAITEILDEEIVEDKKRVTRKAINNEIKKVDRSIRK